MNPWAELDCLETARYRVEVTVTQVTPSDQTATVRLWMIDANLRSHELKDERYRRNFPSAADALTFARVMVRDLESDRARLLATVDWP